MKGKPPKHPHLKLVTGTFNVTRERNRRKPVQIGGAAKRPAYLKGRAREIWDELAPILTRAGILSAADAAGFSVWCHLAAEFEADPTGTSAARITQMRLFGQAFGLDPTGRLRLPAHDVDAPVDPAAKYLTD